MIDRGCALARRMADGLRDAPGVTILNDVVLNQVLVRFAPPATDGAPPDEAAIDAFTRDVIAAVQADGTCWLGGTTWHGMAAMRISVSNWSTTEEDADVSVAAIRRCADGRRRTRSRRDATRSRLISPAILAGMSVGTAFHPRDLAAQPQACSGASGRATSPRRVYADAHDIEYNAIREAAALIDVSPALQVRRRAAPTRCGSSTG